MTPKLSPSRLLLACFALACFALAFTAPPAKAVPLTAPRPQNPHVIPDAEVVLDDLVTVHSPSAPGPMTSSPDGAFLYAAEGGVVAMIDADPNAPDNAAYETPIWRQQVSVLGITPIEMAVDPDMDLNSPLPQALIYIAAGRDGFWVMHADKVHNYNFALAHRVDDSGDLDRSTQYGRKWCNNIDFIEVGGTQYVLATFARANASKLRLYKLSDVRAIPMNAGTAELGWELTPKLQVNLKRKNPSPGGPPLPEGDSYAFGMAVDDANDDVYVALGEHGLIRVHLTPPSGSMGMLAGVTADGPFFGDGSPYESRAMISTRSLYQSVDYLDPLTSQVVYSHSPYFLDVAVEDEGPSRHRVYAALDHLGWCAFDLEVPWQADIWSGIGGYPDFLQEGLRYQLGVGTSQVQNKDQIHLFDGAIFSPGQGQGSTRHVQIVHTQPVGGSPVGTALVVSQSRLRFVLDPGRLNEGRFLQKGLRVGPVPGAAYSADMVGVGESVLVYDLAGSYSQNPNPWTFPGQHLHGYSLAGWSIHVPRDQPDGELHLFVSGRVQGDKVPSMNGTPFANQFATHHLLRTWFDPWPRAGALIGAVHDGSKLRDRHFRDGRYTIGFYPSKVDPDLLITTFNDGGLTPDGSLIYDPVAETIQTPMRDPGSRVLTSGQNPDLVPRLFPENTLRHNASAEILDFGILDSPQGGWVTTGSDGAAWEYRMGFIVHMIGTGFDPRINPPPTSPSDFYGIRFTTGKFRPVYGTSGAIEDIELQNQFQITAPANKFSPLSYYEVEMGGGVPGASFRAFYQGIWSGRSYYIGPETYEDYNAYVVQNFGSDLAESRGIVFVPQNGSPQGVWAYSMQDIQDLLDRTTPQSAFNELRLTRVQPEPTQIGPNGEREIAGGGGLLNHPEFWNVPDARQSRDVILPVEGEFFLRNMPGVGSHPHFNGNLTDLQAWDLEMMQLPNPDYDPVSNPGVIEKRWVLAVASGAVALAETDSVFASSNYPTWMPDSEFWSVNGGYKHMLVRLFDVTDPRLLTGAVDPLFHVALGPNRDSPDIPAYTLIGPDLDTTAYIVKWIHMTDGTQQQVEHDYLLVVDLGGKVYLYDLDGMLSLVPSHHTSEAGYKHFGSFFTDAPVIPTYQTHKSLSDSADSSIFGCDIAQETLGSGGSAQAVTYIYLGVPRLGVEVLKLSFASGASIPSLDYQGLIQTPGNASRLHIEQFPNGGAYPRTLLYVADYDGGVRIYQHPVGQGGN